MCPYSPVCWSLLSVVMPSSTDIQRRRAVPPPATMPSSTAARVALSASLIRSFFSFTSTSLVPPTWGYSHVSYVSRVLKRESKNVGWRETDWQCLFRPGEEYTNTTDPFLHLSLIHTLQQLKWIWKKKQLSFNICEENRQILLNGVCTRTHTLTHQACQLGKPKKEESYSLMLTSEPPPPPSHTHTHQACQLGKPKKEENYSLMLTSESFPPPHPPSPDAFLKRVRLHAHIWMRIP